MARARQRTGFTLIELLVVIAIIALLIGILLPALGEAKRSGRYTQCIAKQEQIGVGINAYSVTYQDKIVSFSWTRKVFSAPGSLGLAPTTTDPIDGLPAYANDLAASSAQAIDIIRRRAHLEPNMMPLPGNWIPQILYNHLALVEDQDWNVATPNVVCPEDAARVRWTRSWEAFNNGAAAPTPTGPFPKRWYASASYNFVPAAMAPDSGPGAILNAGSHRFYNAIVDPYSNVVGKRKYVDVANPAAKVVVHDAEARHFGKRSWHSTYPEAKQPLLFFDGHVKTYANGAPTFTGVTAPIAQRKGNQVNPGWNAYHPTISNYFNYAYISPEPWEAPLRNGSYAGQDTLTGFFRYTRGGLKGSDVESPEAYFAN